MCVCMSARVCVCVSVSSGWLRPSAPAVMKINVKEGGSDPEPGYTLGSRPSALCSHTTIDRTIAGSDHLHLIKKT